jgi:hypothetical protein
MPSEKEKIDLKWYHLRCHGVTGEYYGGIIAGFGMGIAVLACLMSEYAMPPYWHICIVAGLAFMAIGSGIARHAQRQRVTNHNTHEE